MKKGRKRWQIKKVPSIRFGPFLHRKNLFICLSMRRLQIFFYFVLFSIYVSLLKWQFCFYLQYNIKKKEEVVEQQPEEPANPLMRKKKTPEELAAEAEQENLDDFTSKCFTLIIPNRKKER
jgi:hypothetical protein